MRKTNPLFNVIKVIASNMGSLVLGFLIAILLPIMISVHDYGYFQKFLLYSSYLGLFMFGFNDGVNLLYARFTENTIDKTLIRTFFRVCVVWVLVLAIIGVCIFSFVNIGIEEKVIFIMVCVNIILFNLNGFFTHINQILERFTLYSILQILSNLVFILFIILLYFLKVTSFYMFIAFSVASSVVTLAVNLITSRQFVFGKHASLMQSKSAIKDCVKSGFFVMFAALFSLFLTTYPRIIVENTFGIEQFSFFSFANSLLSLVLQVLLAIGVVLYPMIRKLDASKIESVKNLISKSIFYFGTLLLLAYYVVYFFVNIFVVKYQPVLAYLFIIFPLVVYQAKNSILINTFFKTLRKEKLQFVLFLTSLVVSVSVTMLSYFIFKTLFSVIIASTAMYIVCNSVMMATLNHKAGWKTRWYDFMDIAVSIVFILLQLIPNIYVSMALYLLFVVVIFAVRFKDIKSLVKLIISAKFSGKAPNSALDDDVNVENK